MEVAIYISALIMPFSVLYVIVYGLLQNDDIYNSFIIGAKEGVFTVFSILPTLIGLLTAVTVLRESGALDAFSKVLAPLANIFGFPEEMITLGLMKSVSSSGATGLMADIFKVSGPDSFMGRIASVMMSSTETIVYTMSVYFMSIGIKNTRYTLRCAVIANFAGIIASYFVVVYLFGY